MTREEFVRFFKVHRSRFSGVQKWLSAFPVEPIADDELAGMPSQREILAAWFDTLSDCRFVDVLTASRAMAAGELEEPKGYDRHPAALRTEARRHETAALATVAARKVIHGEPVFVCPTCEDLGTISVVDGEYTAAVACTCNSGDRWRTRGLGTYRPDDDVTTDGKTWPECVSEWHSRPRRTGPPIEIHRNYQRELGEYNTTPDYQEFPR